MTVRSALRAPVRAAVRAPIILRKRWTPAALFAQGQQGVWYEPKPQYLYQDAAGTTPVTADGDPVGWMRDLSGNGNHAIQATSAARPIYRADGTLHWLEFDGVDDSFSLADKSSLSAAGSVITLSAESGAGSSTFEATNIGNLGTKYGARSGSATLTLTTRRLESDSFISVSSSIPAGKGVKTWDMHYLEDTASLYFNSSLMTSEIAGHGAGLSSEGSSEAVNIGRAGGASYYTGDIFGIILLVDYREGIPQAQQYLANLAGITL